MQPLLLLLLIAQCVGSVVLLKRLLPGRRRPPPVAPAGHGQSGAEASIIVPTLNEAHRLAPLLGGVVQQGDPVREIIFVDSGSTDGTTDLIRKVAQADVRIVLLQDPPLPAGWIGKAWALQFGAENAKGPWLLGLDADVSPHPALAAAAIGAAEAYELDAVSFAPRFTGQSALERWIQPAILTTLVYRFGAAGGEARAEEVMANGQCFLVKKEVLLSRGGYEPVRSSFAEDVSLARHLASSGARVGFLDGHLLYDVRSYESAGQMWREWGRSVDLKDATPRKRQMLDLVYLVLIQGLPVPLLISAAIGVGGLGGALIVLNLALVLGRFFLCSATAPSYAARGIAFWLNPLADPLAVLRVILSTFRRPRSWRSREY